MQVRCRSGPSQSARIACLGRQGPCPGRASSGAAEPRPSSVIPTVIRTRARAPAPTSASGRTRRSAVPPAARRSAAPPPPRRAGWRPRPPAPRRGARPRTPGADRPGFGRRTSGFPSGWERSGARPRPPLPDRSARVARHSSFTVIAKHRAAHSSGATRSSVRPDLLTARWSAVPVADERRHEGRAPGMPEASHMIPPAFGRRLPGSGASACQRCPTAAPPLPQCRPAGRRIPGDAAGRTATSPGGSRSSPLREAAAHPWHFRCNTPGL
jgi:hypothetical protein